MCNTKQSPSFKYAWSSITQSTPNSGNWMIEWCLRNALALPNPEIVFDAYRRMGESLISRINESCKLVVSPGCTTLQMGQNAAYLAFDRINVPKPCFGGCLWGMGDIGFISKFANMFAPAFTKLVKGKSSCPNLTVARKMSQPIGSRDPYTHAVLKENGIDSRLIGCPTLLSERFLSGWRKVSRRRVVFSFSRCSVPAQIRLITRLRKSWDVSVVIHERYEKQIVKLLGQIKIIEFESPEQFITQYSDADVVVTGRLHGVLPAVRFGTPVVFYGNPLDTRFSLVSFLGIPIRKLSTDLAELSDLPEVRTPSASVFEKVYELRQAFAAYAKNYGIGTKLEL